MPPRLVHDVTKAKIIPERTGPNQLTREYPEFSGFLQGLMGKAPDEVGGGSVLDEDAQSSRKLQALGAKYGFPIGTLAGMLPFGGGVAKAPSVVAGSRTAQKGIVKLPGGNWLSGSAEDAVKGLKRVEMKQPEQWPEGWKQETDALGVEMAVGPGGYSTNVGSIKDPRYKVLADALKYEGDQMAHCVGGYCPDVLEGRSRIFSLRDAKGKPHTTIEVAPWRSSQGESLAQFEARLRADPNRSEEAVRQIMSTPRYTDSIKQIKGFKNGKPDDEYLPYVQDFVKSGKWSDVGDLHNTGLRRTSDAWNTTELARIKNAGIEVPNYLPQAEIDAIAAQVWAPSGYADGGLVSTGYNPELVNARAAQLEAELFN